MAVIVGSGGVGNDKYWLYEWEGLGDEDTGRPVRMGGLADKTVTVNGTFGAGGEVTIQGSQDGTTWHTLSNTQGDPLVISVTGVETITENTKFVRPNVTDGDGNTSLNVRIGASALK
jgi:hypothetical protein